MVEFALAIPVFLLLVFGVFEFGRMLMTYSAVFTASREAARYGSAVGVNASNIPFDHDCAGMRAAAVRVGEVGGVRANLVRIRMLGMDGQPKEDMNGNDVGTAWCNTGVSNAGYDTVLGDQVEVTVAVNYAPVVPLVPIPNLTVNTSTFTGGINSVSSRTIVKNVQALGVGAGSLTQKTLTVVMTPADASGGWVTPNPGTYYYNPGDVVTLTAIPVNANWGFTWGGALSGSVTPTQILMDDNKTVTINFTRKQVTLSIDKVGMGTLKVNGTAILTPYQNIFDSGTVVQIEASPDTSWTFGGWSGGLSGTTSPVSLTMDSNKTLLATFTNVIPYTFTKNTNLIGGTNCTTCSVTISPSQEIYHYGDVVTLMANASLPWAFSSWGPLSGAVITGNVNSNPVTITIQGNTNVTANFLQPGYTVTAIANPGDTVPYSGYTGNGGTITKTPDQSTYHYGDVVTVRAIPDENMYFMSWTGSFGADQTNPKVVTVTGDITMTANFHSAYVLNYAVAGSGTVTGATNNSLYSPLPPAGQVTLTATPAAGWAFAGWTGTVNSTANPLTLTMDSDKILLATFTDMSRLTRTLTITVNNQCGVAIDPLTPWTNPSGATEITKNTQATLTATPPEQCIFGGWSGALTSTANPATLLLDNDKAVTATFTRKQVTLNLDVVFKDTTGQVITGVAGGIVQVNGTTVTVPYQTTFPYGTAVSLQALPAIYWDFSGWSGGLTSSELAPTLTMNGNKTITATFTQKLYRLTLNVVLQNAAGQVLTGMNGGTVSVNGALVSPPYASDFAPNTVVSLVAAPASDWTFTGWSGSATGTSTSTSITIDGDKTITATFTIRQYRLTLAFAMPKSAINFTNTVTITITARTPDGATVISTNTATFTDDNTSGVSMVTNVPYTGLFDAGTQVTLQISATAPGWTVDNSNVPLWSFDGGTTYPVTGASTVVTMSGENKTATAKYPCIDEAFYVSISTTCPGSPCYLPADKLLSPGVNTYLAGLNLNLNLQNAQKKLNTIRLQPSGGTAQTIASPALDGIGIYTIRWNTYEAARFMSQTKSHQLYFDHTASNGSMSINAVKFSNACR